MQEFDGSNSKEDDANDAAETPAVGNGDDLNGVQSDFELSQICENGGKSKLAIYVFVIGLL